MKKLKRNYRGQAKDKRGESFYLEESEIKEGKKGERNKVAIDQNMYIHLEIVCWMICSV